MSKVKHFSFTLVFVICLLCVFLCTGALAEGESLVGFTDTPIYIDGLLSCRGYTAEDTTYVSLESLGAVLDYEYSADCDEEKNTVTVSVADIKISFCRDDDFFFANGRCLYLPDGYKEIEGSVVVPVDAAAKIFGLELVEDSDIIDLSTANMQILASAEEFYDPDELYWMSRIITQESGNQPLEGQIAVGNVVLNRVASDRFPDTVKDVIFQTGQFSPVGNGYIYKDPYPISEIAAMLVFEDYNTVGDALFFQVGRYGAVADIATWVMKIGDHNFFI